MRLRAVLLGIVVAAHAVVAHAAGPNEAEAEQRFAEAVERERAQRGLHSLTAHAELVAVARRHAERMAAEGRLHHNENLPNEVSNWETLGENVGRGWDVDEIHQEFMASSTHRDQILGAGYTEIGIGVAFAADGELWVAEVFRQPAADRPASEPAAAEPDRPVQAAATRSRATADEAASVPAPAPLAPPAPPQPPTPPAEPNQGDPAPVGVDLDALGAALAAPAPALSDTPVDVVAATRPIAVTIPAGRGIPLLVEIATALLLLIIGLQTITFRRLALI